MAGGARESHRWRLGATHLPFVRRRGRRPHALRRHHWRWDGRWHTRVSRLAKGGRAAQARERVRPPGHPRAHRAGAVPDAPRLRWVGRLSSREGSPPRRARRRGGGAGGSLLWRLACRVGGPTRLRANGRARRRRVRRHRGEPFGPLAPFEPFEPFELFRTVQNRSEPFRTAGAAGAAGAAGVGMHASASRGRRASCCRLWWPLPPCPPPSHPIARAHVAPMVRGR